MAFLLRARFNSSGPTNPDIINLGGVSFNHKSRIHEGDRCAFFEPSNDNAALQIIGTTRNNIGNHVGKDDCEYTVYFKFCIDLRDRLSTESIPIISYIDHVTGKSLNWISIENNNQFSISIDGETRYNCKRSEWVFDDYWHTFTLCKTKYLTTLFLDGIVYSVLTMPETIPIKNTSAIFIGRKAEAGMTDHFSTLESAMLDDICITDNAVYSEHFIPPNKYFSGADIISNYFWNLETDMAYMPRDLIEYTDKKMVSTVFMINEKQKEWLPRRLRIQWHEEEYLWDCENYWKVSKTRDYVAISIWGLEQPLLMDPWNEEFVDIFNCFYAWEEDKLYPFMLFIDYKFIKLSDIYIMKSGQYYTMFIKGMKPDKYNLIKSVDLVYIPFRCFYEEYEPKRMDIEPLYSFNEQGLFDPYKAVFFYYLDKERSPDIECLPIRDEDIPPFIAYDDPDVPDARLIFNHWRYGRFTVISKTSTYVTVKFNSSDNSYQARPGDKVNLYRNTICMQEDTYDIVGVDTFRFYYFNPYGYEGLLNKTISMQFVTEVNPINAPPILTGLMSMKEETVYATEKYQCSFKIPEIVDEDGFVYRNFLVFRNSVCMNALHRFKLNYNNKYITFNNPMDIINEGDPITFVFLKTVLADHYGPLHIKPVYLYTHIGDGGVPVNSDGSVSKIKIPPYKGIKYNKDNVFFFVNGTLISPYRYTITDNTVVMNPTPRSNNFFQNKEVTFVVLRLVSGIEDPIDPRDKVISYQLKQGARFILHDLLIDKRVKITLDNLVMFDRKGRYMPSFTGEVMNLNIVKFIKSTIDPFEYIPRYLTCVWSSKRSLPNEANIIRPDNTLFMKDYIKLYQEFYELDIDFNQFMMDFNVVYHRNMHYGINLQRAFFFMISYNQLSFIDLYKKRSKMQRIKLNLDRLNDRIRSTGIMGPVCMDRSLYKDPAHRTFCIFFENGKIPKWYKDMTYNLNQLYLRFPKLFDTKKDEVEVFKFHDLNNILVPLDAKIT